jgi:exopolysaccharide biosynthesis polyprenyl glycosylphosphotransferase
MSSVWRSVATEVPTIPDPVVGARPGSDGPPVVGQGSWIPPAPEAFVRPSTRRGRSALPALLGADVIAVSLALFGAYDLQPAPGRGGEGTALLAVLYAPLFLAVLAAYGLYRRGRRRLVASSFPDLSHLFHGMVVASLLLLFVTGATSRLLGLPRFDRHAVLIAGAFCMVAVVVARMVARGLSWRLHGHQSRVLVVGSGQMAANVLTRVSSEPGLHIVGCVDDKLGGAGVGWGNVELLGGLDDIPELIERHDVDHLVVAFSPVNESRLAGLLRSLADRVQISVVPRMFDLLSVQSRVDELAGLPVVDVAPASLGPTDRFAKRALDLFVSGLSLVILAPVLAVIAVGVKLTSPGPVLFRQNRTGRSGNVFEICKFRTMRVGAESERSALQVDNQVDGPLFKIKDDPRVTPLGRVLRATSLDELPQLFNVLIGDMSLVGPRPFVVAESQGIDGWAARRFNVRPGMTGLWQISGRNDLPFDELRRLDYSYVASWSLWWDLRILWHTPASVLRRRGAY